MNIADDDTRLRGAADDDRAKALAANAEAHMAAKPQEFHDGGGKLCFPAE